MIVKICGVTRPEDGAAAVTMGADLVGMVFAPGSPRVVTPEVAREIVLAVAGEARTVGVFVDEDPGEIQRIRRAVGFDIVQLHGGESPEATRALVDRLGGRVIKAFRGEAMNEASKFERLFARLFDGSEPGSGNEWDWSRVAAAPRDRPVMLAGGLTIDNLEQAVAQANPDGLDVSSGVESAPGIKDLILMGAFISLAKGLSPEPLEAEGDPQ